MKTAKTLGFAGSVPAVFVPAVFRRAIVRYIFSSCFLRAMATASARFDAPSLEKSMCR